VESDRLNIYVREGAIMFAAIFNILAIPPRTEMILEGKLAKTAYSKIGMIEPCSGLV
jgi:hypothetical protein